MKSHQYGVLRLTPVMIPSCGQQLTFHIPYASGVTPTIIKKQTI